MLETVLVIHILIAIAMIILVLLQRSEGGALGIGGGQGGGLFTGRGVADTLTRLTTILAVVFFMTSIALTVLTSMQARESVLGDYGGIPEEDKGIQAPAPALPSTLPELPNE